MKIIVFIFLTLLSLYAKEVTAIYKITFGIFGQIGEAQTTMNVDEKGNYTINMLAQAKGLASALSGERTEWFFSKGKELENGMLRPDYYEHKVVRNRNEYNKEKKIWVLITKTKIKEYTFNHIDEIVEKKQTKLENDKVSKTEYKKLEYYADNDLLSLFFNFKGMSKNFTLQKPDKMYAVGANKKDGRVDVIPPKEKKLSILKDELEVKDGHFYITYINQKIFSSQRGELYINLNDEGFCKKAILKDVIFFGDIMGELISLHVKKTLTQ